jgi:hydroxyacylglutathione hydrolase
MERIVDLNRGPFVGAPAQLEPLAMASSEAVVLDVRTPEAFGAGHVAGALNVPVDRSSFATRAGFVLRLDRPIVLHGEPDQLERAARGLRSVGFLELAGHLVDPPADERLDSVELPEARQLVASGEVDLVDVREDDEWERSSIPGSIHVPFSRVRDAVAGGLVDGRPVITICESGARAAVAASVLAAAGVQARPVLHGGVPNWPG